MIHRDTPPRTVSYNHVSPTVYQPSRQKATPKRFVLKSRYVNAAYGITLLATFTILSIGTYAASQSKAQTNPKSTNEVVVSPPTYQKINTASLQTNIERIIAAYPAVQISVAYRDIKTKQSGTYGVQAPYVAASTAKILSATLFLRGVEEGRYSLQQNIASKPAHTQLRLLIEESDQQAWEAINGLIGHGALNAFAQDIGMTHYTASGNTTTPQDIALLLSQLYQGKLLSSDHKNLVLSHMQRASESQYIVSAVPEGRKVYHKSGYLRDRAHDAAIIDDGKQPIVLVIFTKVNSDYDFVRGAKIMHDITTAVLNAYKPGN